jgi:hypothetical protein
MLAKLFAHLRQQWMGALALFLVIAGSTAYAANTIFSTDIVDGEVKAADIGTAAVQTAEVGNNQIRSADVRDDNLAGGGLTTADIANESLTTNDIAGQGIARSDIQDETLTGAQILDGSIGPQEVGNESLTGTDIDDETLTGADIANQSGVDTCTHGANRFGELCVGVANQHDVWAAASGLCASLELRLPSLGEARALAENHDLPNVDESEWFWTEETIALSASVSEAYIVSDDGSVNRVNEGTSAETVCVTTPTN